jgi:hypothetical protein
MENITVKFYLQMIIGTTLKLDTNPEIKGHFTLKDKLSRNFFSDFF